MSNRFTPSLPYLPYDWRLAGALLFLALGSTGARANILAQDKFDGQGILENRQVGTSATSVVKWSSMGGAAVEATISDGHVSLRSTGSGISGFAIDLSSLRKSVPSEVLKIEATFHAGVNPPNSFGIGTWDKSPALSDAKMGNFRGLLVSFADGQLSEISDDPSITVSQPYATASSTPFKTPTWMLDADHTLSFYLDEKTGKMLGSLVLNRVTYTSTSTPTHWKDASTTFAGFLIQSSGSDEVLISNFSVMGFPATHIPESFVHPGILHSRQDLDRMKAKVATGGQPWADAFAKFKMSPFAQADYKVHGPFDTVERGKKSNLNRSGYEDDAVAAYQNALMWAITGDHAHANKTLEILNGYSKTLTHLTGDDVQLLASLTGNFLVNAAEIMRSTDAGWAPEDIARFGQMLRTIYYPLIQPYGDGNWGSGCVKAVMAMGVFLDDRAMFTSAVSAFKYGVGARDRVAVEEYILPTGENGESGRDQGHSQLGIAHLAEAAQIASNQGIDLYAWGDNRLLTGFDYAARYNLGHDDLPFETFGTGKGAQFTKISELGRGDLRPIYEMAYNHYASLGVHAPSLDEAVRKLRPEGAMTPAQKCDHPGYGTLFYALGPLPQQTDSALTPSSEPRSSTATGTNTVQQP